MMQQLQNAEHYLEIARATGSIKVRMERLLESFLVHGRSQLDDAMLGVFIATAQQITQEAQGLASLVPPPPSEPEPEPE